MVANNIGRAETGIVAGNFMGVLHSVVTNHKFNQIFLRRMNNTTNFRPENSPHRTNFRSKFRVAFTPSRNLSPKVRAVQNNTCLENSRKCRRRFVSVKNSSKSPKFRRQVFALLLHNTVGRLHFSRALGTLVVFPLNSHWLFKEFSFVRIYHCDYFGFGFTTLNQKVLLDDELLLQDNKGGGELFNSAVYLQYWLAHQHDNPG